MDFAELMQTNPPRMVVLFNRAPDGQEQFQWGMVGSIPILAMIGKIDEVKFHLHAGSFIPECEQCALIIAVEPGGEIVTYLNGDIPRLSLAGILDVARTVIINQFLANANKSPVLGPNGMPLKRPRMGGM